MRAYMARSTSFTSIEDISKRQRSVVDSLETRPQVRRAKLVKDCSGATERFALGAAL